MKAPTGKTTYTMLPPSNAINSPVIVFDYLAIKWIRAIVDIHSEEVGFYAVVDEREDGSYFIRDVFYPKHSEMHTTTCEISPEGEANLMNWLFNNNREADIEKVRFWGHSHHTMGTNPSSQDEKQSLERIESTESFLIRAICNKAGEISLSFFDNKRRIRFDNVKWTVQKSIDPLKDVNTINNVQEIINSEVQNSDKIKNIKNLLETDEEMEEIRSKVKDLKKVNEPPKVVNKGYYHNHKNGSNPMFGDDDFYDPMDNWRGYHDRKKFEQYPYTSRAPLKKNKKDPIMEEEEVDKILEKWERQRYL